MAGHCEDHDSLIRDAATAAANSETIKQDVGEIKGWLIRMNGQVRRNEIDIKTARAKAAGVALAVSAFVGAVGWVLSHVLDK